MKNILVLFTLAISGCTGVGVVATSDPAEKLQQAYSLMFQDRAALAEYILKQALDIYKVRGDTLGIAETYHAFGNLYISRSYHGTNAETFKRFGTYDATYENSINNFNMAAELFDQMHVEVGVVKSLVGVGNAYVERSDLVTACNYFSQALSRYNAGKKSGSIDAEPQSFDKRFSSMGQVIDAYIKHYECVVYDQSIAEP